MKRITIKLDAKLATALDGFVRNQRARTSVEAVVKKALRVYIASGEKRRPRRVLRVTPATRGSGLQDVSEKHDRYLALATRHR